jgi:inorganic pyrophosphatase
MGLNQVAIGDDLPNRFNVIIEISMNAAPIKYEIDARTGVLFVDRFMNTARHYPCNYGYIPQTSSADGDPVDVLLVTPYPVAAGVVVCSRAPGLLRMQDQGGGDDKILATPDANVLPMYAHWKEYGDVQPQLLQQIQHFFEHYKDVEPGKWVKVSGWDGVDAARRELLASRKRFAPHRKGRSAAAS